MFPDGVLVPGDSRKPKRGESLEDYHYHYQIINHFVIIIIIIFMSLLGDRLPDPPPAAGDAGRVNILQKGIFFFETFS